MSKKQKRILILTVSVLAVGICGFLSVFFVPNFSEERGKTFIEIYPDFTFNQAVAEIDRKAHLKSRFTFLLAAKTIGSGKGKIRAGRYEITPSMNNFALLRKLRNGSQTPIKLTFNNIRTREQLAARLSAQLIADSMSIITLLNDFVFLQQYGLTPETAVTLFIPDTYEFYWTTAAPALFERMEREYRTFWTDKRRKKAAEIPLSPVEVATLASIVEEESNYQPERPTIAGLYINRLKKHMKLQADPTVKFANADFGLRRIRNGHLDADSPYNTYLHYGLPPGPIRVASENAIDAVLNYEQHDYLFMCAKETFDGQHNFATTYAEHQKNAQRYRKALNERNIK